MNEHPWESTTCYSHSDGDTVLIGNEFIERSLSIQGGSVRTSSITNKITGRVWRFHSGSELRLVFAAGEHIHIPHWYYRPGTPEAVAPDDDAGYLTRYFDIAQVDEKWRCVDRFTSVAESCGQDTDPVWPGYGWFFHELQIPAAQGEPVHFHFGGYDHCDWERYRVFVNGHEIGSYKHDGEWREPVPIVIAPGEESYDAIRFGEANTIVVQCGGLNKMLPHGIEAEREHYFHDSYLCDQFLSIGEPYREASHFTVRQVAVGGDRSRRWAKVVVVDEAEKIEATITYAVRDGDPLIRKTVEAKNTGHETRLLLDAYVDDFSVHQCAVAPGGHGTPVLVDDEAFVAIEHPVGVNRGGDARPADDAGGARISLGHHPGVPVTQRHRVKLKSTVWGVSEAYQAKTGFHAYLKRYGKRKDEYRTVYDPLGYYDACRPLNERGLFTEEVALDSIGKLEELKQKGIDFDYYIIDYGWADPYGDYKAFHPDAYPNGPGKLISEVKRLGMKFGLWFGVSYRPWTIGYNPDLQHCATPRPAGPDDMCIAAEPYRSYFRDAIVYHIHHSSMKACKIDMSRFCCNATDHGHLPGKYSVEASMTALADIATVAYRECPELFLFWYWKFSSPFWALYGSTIFDKRLNMEAAAVASAPNVSYRQSATLNLDQAARYADLIPASIQDSLGIWIGNVAWANRMGKVDWKGAWLMDVLRGGLLNQLWGDFFLFDDEDERFLAEWWSYFNVRRAMLPNSRPILGDPWKVEPYGHVCGDGERAIVAIHNPGRDVAELELSLAELLTPVDATATGAAPSPSRSAKTRGAVFGRQLYPVAGVIPLRGDSAKLALKPYEIKVIEALSGEPAPDAPVLPDNQIAPTQVLELTVNDADPVQSPLNEMIGEGTTPTHAATASAKLPEITTHNTLVVAVEILKGDAHHYRGDMAKRIKAQAKIDGSEIVMSQVPSNPDITNGPGSPWTVFTCVADREFSGKQLDIAVVGLLPDGVEWRISGWVCEV